MTAGGGSTTASSRVPQLFDRRAVRKGLARASRREAPALLAELVDALLERLHEFRRPPQACLLLGARRGSVIHAVQRHPDVGPLTVLAPDLACLAVTPAAVVIGDDELPPFAPATFDTVLAPLVLHTVNDVPGTLVQIRRILRPGGLFLASLPAEDTLRELGEVLLEAEAETTGGASLRMAPLADVQTLGNLLSRTGFHMPVADIDRRRLMFDSVDALLRMLGRAGERGVLLPARAHRLSKSLLVRARRLYATRYRQSGGGITASLDLVTLTGRVPAGSEGPNGNGH